MGRHPLIFGLLMLVLIASCTTAVPDPNPGQLLYVATFDDFNDDWTLYEGELAAQIVDDGQNPALKISVGDVQEGAFTVAKPVFGDFDVTVDVAQVAGPVDLDAPGFGLIFRHQDNQNFYLFMISGDGYYQVKRRVNGVDEVLSDWAPSDVIAQGLTANTIRVIGKDDTFQFLINDQIMPLCQTIWNWQVPGECQVPTDDASQEPQYSPDAVTLELVDDSFAQGHIGVGARSFDQSGIEVFFDNMLVCGPYDEPPIPFRCQEIVPEDS